MMTRVSAKFINVPFLNYSTDGVSFEQDDVRTTICRFLDGDINHLAATDTNHNIKCACGQVVGAGSGLISIGECVVDSDLLRQAGVSQELIRPKDIASDLVVKKLVSYKSLEKLESLRDDGNNNISPNDIGALAATPFFMNLHLHAVNGNGVPAVHRVFFLWTSMIWMTTLSGVCITTKRNIVSETIAMIFLVLRSDVNKPRLLTSEPAEHDFGTTRTKKREFTACELASLSEVTQRKDDALYKGNLVPSREAAAGYGSTCEKALIFFFIFMELLVYLSTNT